MKELTPEMLGMSLAESVLEVVLARVPDEVKR